MMNGTKCWFGYHNNKIVAVSNEEAYSENEWAKLFILARYFELDQSKRKFILCQCQLCQRETVFGSPNVPFLGYTTWTAEKFKKDDIGNLLDYMRKPLHWQVFIPGWQLNKNPFTGEEYERKYSAGTNPPPNWKQRYE
jgi:hypothetical protein